MTAVIDVETDSSDSNKANLKYFGGLDIDTGEIVMFPHTANVQIADYIKKHKILIGYNLKGFDIPVLERFGIRGLTYIDKRGVQRFSSGILDLYEILAPKGYMGYGKNNKNRLYDINPGIILKNYKLKTIISTLKLDDEGKGEMDYNILKQESWNSDEIKIIEKYLKQDLNIENKLFSWYRNTFKPLEQYLMKEDVAKFKHLTCTSGCLGYKLVCSLTGMKEEYNDYEVAKKLKQESKKISGGYHIHARWEKVRGNIICRDFVSHYPTTIIQYQLHHKNVNNALEKALHERLKAKENNNKATSLALKVPLNSIYGTFGNAKFKHIFNPEAADNCTRIARELIKRYAKTLDVAGFKVIYGFTDSVYAGIPKGLTSDNLDTITKYFIDTTRKEAIKPLDSYNLGVDGIYKFMWFIDLKDNNYLTVDKDNHVHVKGALFDKNTPPCINELFELYIKPRIIKDLDVDFTQEELLFELNQILKAKPETSAKDYSAKSLSDYKTTTSLNAQISDMYGPGVHPLIPNTAEVGAGRNKKLRYCSLDDFKKHKLSFEDISIDRMLIYIKPFYSTKEEVYDLDKPEVVKNE